MKIGKLPENVLKRSVLRQMNRKGKRADGAGLGEDCAVFSFPEGVCPAVCVQEAAVKTATDQGEASVDGSVTGMGQLIQRCANNLAAGGARAADIQVALLLPETAEEADIRLLMQEAAEKCRELDICIAGGQTRISGAVKSAVAVVTGCGIPFDAGENITAVKKTNDRHRLSEPAPGQDIVVSKWIGLEGTAILARKNRERLLARYPAYFVEEAAGFDRWLSVIPEAATAVKSGVCAMHDASEGGIFGALWELAQRAGAGLTIDLKKLPIRQETVEVCECCSVNPYELLSGGSLVMTAWDGRSLAEALEAEGIPAAVVGRLTDSNDRIIVNDGEIRYMDRPGQDEIYRWLSETLN